MKIIFTILGSLLLIISCSKNDKKQFFIVENKREKKIDTLYYINKVERKKDSLIITNTFSAITETFYLNLKTNSGIYKGNPMNASKIRVLPSILLHTSDSTYSIMPIFLYDPKSVDKNLIYYWNDYLGLFYFKSLSWGNSGYALGENSDKNNKIIKAKNILDTLNFTIHNIIDSL